MRKANTVVYSLETATGTLIASSGIVVHNCFPRHVGALIAIARQAGATSHIMESVDRTNELQSYPSCSRRSRLISVQLQCKTLAIWLGCSAARTDDVREMPARRHD